MTETEDGIVNVTRLVLPATVATAEDGVVNAVPPADGFSETVTAVAGMVPVGKPAPVKLMTVTPGWPEAGEAVRESVTAVCAVAKIGPSSAVAAIAIRK